MEQEEKSELCMATSISITTVGDTVSLHAANLYQWSRMKEDNCHL